VIAIQTLNKKVQPDFTDSHRPLNSYCRFQQTQICRLVLLKKNRMQAERRIHSRLTVTKRL